MPKKTKEPAPEVEAQAEEAPPPAPAPLAVSAPPPHTMAVFQILKQRFREYHSGPGAIFTVTTPAGQAHTAALAISGTIDVDPTILVLPPTVQVQLAQSSTVMATRAAPVTSGSPGTYTTTFPANTLAAGPATATASSQVPLKSATTPTFTMT